MGFTVVNTKERGPRLSTAKERGMAELSDMTEQESQRGDTVGTGGTAVADLKSADNAKRSADTKRLGSSRQKAREADAKRKEKDVEDLTDDEIDMMTNKMMFNNKIR